MAVEGLDDEAAADLELLEDLLWVLDMLALLPDDAEGGTFFPNADDFDADGSGPGPFVPLGRINFRNFSSSASALCCVLT